MESQKILNNSKEDREGWTSLVVQQLRLHASRLIHVNVWQKPLQYCN